MQPCLFQGHVPMWFVSSQDLICSILTSIKRQNRDIQMCYVERNPNTTIKNGYEDLIFLSLLLGPFQESDLSVRERWTFIAASQYFIYSYNLIVSSTMKCEMLTTDWYMLQNEVDIIIHTNRKITTIILNITSNNTPSSLLVTLVAISGIR